MAAISKDYAVALFAIACEEERVEELWSALERVHTVLLESTELCAVLDAPSLSTAERLSLLDRIFEDTLPAHVLSLLKLLAEKRRISLFSDIRKEYRTLLDAHNSLTTAHVNVVFIGKECHRYGFILQILGKPHASVLKEKKLTRHTAPQAVHAGNAVTHENDGAGLLHFKTGVIIFDLFFNDAADLFRSCTH